MTLILFFLVNRSASNGTDGSKDRQTQRDVTNGDDDKGKHVGAIVAKVALSIIVADMGPVDIDASSNQPAGGENWGQCVKDLEAVDQVTDQGEVFRASTLRLID